MSEWGNLSEVAKRLIVAGRSKRANDDMDVPIVYRGKALENLLGFDGERERARTAILGGRTVFITGPCGSGKTHFAVGLLNLWAAANNPRAARFLSTLDFVAELRAGFGSGCSENQMMGSYVKMPLLLLDDLGAQRTTDWVREAVVRLIDARYRAVKPIIVTSNLTLDRLATELDDRAVSRLVEMGVIITLDGPDYRIGLARDASASAWTQ